MKQYLVDFFNYNDWAFRKLLNSVGELPEKEEAVKLLSHLITSHDKWYNRVTKKADDNSLNWFGQAIPLDELGARWLECLNKWIRFINDTDESALENEIVFQRPSDGKNMSVKL